MSRIKKLCQKLIAAVSVLCLISFPVAAAENYTYTVTFYAGNQGSFTNASGLSVTGQGSATIQNDGDKIVIRGLQEGDLISFDAQQGAVQLGNDSKYYVQGVRPSARDNDMASLSASAFRVTEDEDYVVAYGIRGNQVEYTVNYEDEEGNTLAPSRTYYGNIGDKPVVAYLYIENYLPQALALTKTLSSDASQNIFTFTYHEVSPEVITEPGEVVTITTVIPGTNTVQTIQVPAQAAGVAGAGTGAGAGTAAGTTAGETGGAGAAEGTAAGETEGETPDAGEETITPNETPEGIVDLDENETPKGDGTDVVKETEKKGVPLAVGIGIGATGLIVLGVLLALIRKFRK